jgi:hypothetical protein
VDRFAPLLLLATLLLGELSLIQTVSGEFFWSSVAKSGQATTEFDLQLAILILSALAAPFMLLIGSRQGAVFRASGGAAADYLVVASGSLLGGALFTAQNQLAPSLASLFLVWSALLATGIVFASEGARRVLALIPHRFADDGPSGAPVRPTLLAYSFFSGAAFSFLELRTISALTPHFGSTYLGQALVIMALIGASLMGTALAASPRGLSPPLVWALLFVALAGYLFFLYLRAASPAEVLAMQKWNLIGGAIGGLAECSVIVWGFGRSLYVAVAFYGLALLFGSLSRARAR